MANKFKSICEICNEVVLPGVGRCHRKDGKWITRHYYCKKKYMKFTLNNKEIEPTQDEINEIVKQSKEVK